jgi:hypothetical protein
MQLEHRNLIAPVTPNQATVELVLAGGRSGLFQPGTTFLEMHRHTKTGGPKVFPWQSFWSDLQPWRSLKDTGRKPVSVVIKCRERREIRRRLRHCIGLRTPTGHCRSRKCGTGGKAGARFEVRSQDIGLMALVRGEVDSKWLIVDSLSAARGSSINYQLKTINHSPTSPQREG